jgi:cytidyltransferase-like protein
MPRKIGVLSGGFDPLHSGHIEMIKDARSRCDLLLVGINSDDWLTRKKGRFFMPIEERLAIVSAIGGVDHAFPMHDSDGTARYALTYAKACYPEDRVIFMNGGDRNSGNIPEMDVAGVEFEFGVGGEHKKNSSSWLLGNWTAPKTDRPWGWYRVMHTEGNHTKVKELMCMPGQSLSMQRHEHRSEVWYVSSGQGKVELADKVVDLKFQDIIHIPQGAWHRLHNPYDEPVKIVEIQHGTSCDEADIERRS